MSRPDPPLISQISKKHRVLIQNIFELQGGNLSRDEFFHRTKENWMTEQGFIYNTTQYAAQRIHLKSTYECTDEEAEAMLAASIYELNLVERGVARRIMTEDPGELEAALSLSARLGRVGDCRPSRPWGNSYPDIWMALRGLAAGDIEVAQAIFRARRHDSRGGHKPTVLIYDAAEAIVTKDQPAQARLAPRMASCRMPDWLRAILETLQGIIEADASLVARGLERVLATFRRGESLNHEMIISFHAHALAELAHWVSPGLLAEFPVDQPLPWDRAYYQWLRRTPRSTTYRDLSACSSPLNRWVHDLEEPGWWRREQESAEEEHPAPGSSSISEEAGSDESDGIALRAHGTSALLMIRAAAPAGRNRASNALDVCDIGRTKMHSLGPDGAETMIPWLKNVASDHKICPWLLSARFKGERWIHCIASRPGLVSVGQLASNKALQVLTADFDPQENRTVARFFKNGGIAAELAAAGKGEDSLEVLSFESSVKTKAFLKRCQTVRQAVEGFFAEFDAKARDLVVIAAEVGLELRAANGQAIRDSELDELAITYYAPLTTAENPAGVRLYQAIQSGDVGAARQAIAEGASLEFVPDLMVSPLSTAFYDSYPGDWRGVAKLLVDAGAPIDGYDWENPPICGTISPLIKNEESIIRQLQAMLSLGADIHSPGRHGLDTGCPPLHVAIVRGYPQVVRFLLGQGAGPEARNAEGQTALELAEWMAHEYLRGKSADCADEKVSAADETGGRLNPLETFVRLLSGTPQEIAKRRIQVVRLLREVAARRDHG
jgi:hypothetical protein